MHGKKQRILSFLMAFILIFTFAFINPLTVSQSYAALPAVVLSANAIKIIAGIVASSGLVITAGVALEETNYESAVEAFTYVIYRTLNGAEKLALGALSVVDNIVEVPISLYNAIVNRAKSLFQSTDYAQTLVQQGISVKYANLTSNNYDDPDLYLTIYNLSNDLSSSFVTNREIDMREAEPFLVYDGSLSDVNELWQSEAVSINAMDFSNSDDPILNIDDTSTYKYLPLTPDLSGYNIPYSSSAYYNVMYLRQKISDQTTELGFGTSDGSTISKNRTYMGLNGSWVRNIPATALKLYYYLIHVNGVTGFMVDIYNGDNFVGQRTYTTNSSGFGEIITTEVLKDNVSDLTVVTEEMPTPVITNTDASANVLTLPTTVADSIGLTSTDVNVGTSDIPNEGGGTNTETIENINTNVGELVTGGTLGEQVNTNIGTVEGLHGELTEQVDFGAVFDTIAQYISSLDISSVTWFPTAVASFLVPFLPVISLGLILFFIDRVLNGGA